MKLSEICEYTTKRIETESLGVDNYISTENMLQNKGGVVAAAKVPAEKAVAFNPGDILISNIRPYFKKIWLADKRGGCSSDVLCIRALSGIDKTYLYYLLSQDSFFEYVMSGAKGSKMPRGDKAQIMNWEVSIPDFAEQKRVGEFLKSIDDKIALNNRINHNLEEQAQSLYKSWFVDFEPFKDGKFVDSELGMIPEGWSVLRFEEFIDLSNERVNSEMIPEFSVTNNGIFPRDVKFNKQLSSSSLKNKVIRKGNLVFGMSREILNWGIMKEPIGGVSSAYTIYVINEKLVSPHYLEYFIKNHISYFKDLIKPAAREGQGIDKTLLASKQIVLPSMEVWKRFRLCFDVLFKEILHSNQEVLELKIYRDVLLPALISGQITC